MLKTVALLVVVFFVFAPAANAAPSKPRVQIIGCGFKWDVLALLANVGLAMATVEDTQTSQWPSISFSCLVPCTRVEYAGITADVCLKGMHMYKLEHDWSWLCMKCMPINGSHIWYLALSIHIYRGQDLHQRINRCLQCPTVIDSFPNPDW